MIALFLKNRPDHVKMIVSRVSIDAEMSADCNYDYYAFSET